MTFCSVMADNQAAENEVLYCRMQISTGVWRRHQTVPAKHILWDCMVCTGPTNLFTSEWL